MIPYVDILLLNSSNNFYLYREAHNSMHFECNREIHNDTIKSACTLEIFFSTRKDYDM